MRGLNTIIRFFGSVMLVGFCSLTASAQVGDSIAFQTDRDTTVKYVSPLEYAFMMHEETKFMLRVPVFGVGVEVEILPYFTFMAQVYYPMAEISSDFMLAVLDAELRWYYGSKNLGMRNMSGNYLAAGARQRQSVKHQYSFDGPSSGLYAKWGMQRRILGSGLADIGVLAGVSSRSINGRKGLGIFIESSALLGFGFVFNKQKPLDRERLCPVLKCHDVERYLFKVNFANLISFYTPEFTVGGLQYLNFNPNIASEIKIFNLPLSINVDLKWNIVEMRNTNMFEVPYKYHNFEWQAGGRWYYNMGRRMRLGKGGNGLSANYVAAGIGAFNLSSSVDQSWRNKYPLAFISTGIQRTLGRRLYYDLNIGVRQSGYIHRITNWEVNKSGIEVFGNAQIGVKF